MSDTHYIPALTERNGRDQLAACNRWVRSTEHSDEPTCPTCLKYVLDDSRELSADDIFGALDRSTLVPVRPDFDPTR
jgi:hypothetical protein